MPEYVIVAETGSDISHEVARRYGIELVPMHVNFAEGTRDDGSFEPEELYDSYKRTKKLPHTAGCSPQDFTTVFDRIHAEKPDAQIVYLAYSAATTVSFESAHIAAEGRDYVTCIDTKSVSSGQGMVVRETCEWLAAHPDATIDDIKTHVNGLARRIRMAFIPGDLDYLRAGGRLTNTAYLGATLLRIKPVVEVKDGKLVATEKDRGGLEKCIARLTERFVTREPMDLSRIFIIYTIGSAPNPVRQKLVEGILHRHGAQEIEWIKSGCVIASHSGPNSFGIVGLAK